MEVTGSLQVIAICLLAFLIVGFVVYVFSQKTRKLIDRVYDRNIHFLQNKKLSFLAKGLCHGGIHFVIFILVLVLILFMIQKTNGYKVDAHKIGISFRRVFLPHAAVDTTYDIKRFNLKFILNSDSVYKRTNGESRNSIRIDYFSDSQDSISCGVVRLECNFKKYPIRVIRDTVWSDSLVQNGGKKLVSFNYKADYECTKENDSIYEVKFYPAKNRLSLMGLKYGWQSVEIACDAFGNEKDNPYFYYFIKLLVNDGDLKPDGYNVNYSIHFGDINEKGNLLFEQSSKDIKYNFVFPEPDVVTDGEIKYNSVDAFERIKKGKCITIQAEDIDLLNKSNRDVFLFSVLAGMLTGFILDILAQQVRELRNINRRRKDNE